MSKLKLLAGLSAALIATSLMAAPALASCRDGGSCELRFGKSVVKRTGVKKKLDHRVSLRQVRPRKLSRRSVQSDAALAIVAPRNRDYVAAMIRAQAPRYGVPAWFALRIAKIESGFNPRARGAAGEYGVFQLKCATARGIGFRGNCGNLLNAETNIQFGLKHLSLAVRSSRGNLKLAASKHNGGLGRKRLVPGYVSRVF